MLIFQDEWDDDNSYRFPQKEEKPDEDNDEEEDTACPFPTQRIWIISWMVMNILAIIGLGVAIGLFANLGFWSMSHQPIHLALFAFIVVLVILLIYAEVIIITLYMILKDSYLMGIMGSPNPNPAGLTTGGRRVAM